MSDSTSDVNAVRDLSREEMMSALFAHLVIQNTNMALMLLGQIPHPESGERLHDVEAARVFIDQLEMLEAKTKGNLSREEEKLLKQSLTHLRMTFVEVAANPPKAETSKAPEVAPPAEPKIESPAAGSEAEAESRKRFSKKF